jgi:hypothetical protein
VEHFWHGYPSQFVRWGFRKPERSFSRHGNR